MTQRTAYHPKLCEECNKPLVECICLTGFKFENQVLDEIKFNEFKKLLNVS